MYLIMYIMMAGALFVLFMCGYYVGVFKQKYGKSWLHIIPIIIAILMVNVVWAIVEIIKSGRWQ